MQLDHNRTIHGVVVLVPHANRSPVSVRRGTHPAAQLRVPPAAPAYPFAVAGRFVEAEAPHEHESALARQPGKVDVSPDRDELLCWGNLENEINLKMFCKISVVLE